MLSYGIRTFIVLVVLFTLACGTKKHPQHSDRLQKQIYRNWYEPKSASLHLPNPIHDISDYNSFSQIALIIDTNLKHEFSTVLVNGYIVDSSSIENGIENEHNIYCGGETVFFEIPFYNYRGTFLTSPELQVYCSSETAEPGSLIHWNADPNNNEGVIVTFRTQIENSTELGDINFYVEDNGSFELTEEVITQANSSNYLEIFIRRQNHTRYSIHKEQDFVITSNSTTSILLPVK